MLTISSSIALPDNEIEIKAIRAQGAGGQNVNKVSTAVHLRFDIRTSSLPEPYKTRLLNLSDYRITKEGIINIKAQRYRTQLQNKEDALSRLQQLIQQVLVTAKMRKPTKATKASKTRRLDSKSKHSNLKSLRNKRSLDKE